MLKCPYCHFDNEDGALFCEQCKSDLAGAVPANAQAIPVAHAEPVMAEPVMAEPVMAEPVMAEVISAEIVEAVPIPLEPIPLAEGHGLATAEPVMAEPIALQPIVDVPAAPSPAAPTPPPPTAAPVPPPAASAPEAIAPAAPPTPAPPSPPPAAPAPQAAAPAPAPAAQPGPAPAAAEPAPTHLPPGAQPRLVVLRGQKRNVEYPIYEGVNFIGRADEKPVDIDLEDQEPPDRVWCSRQHACISLENDQLSIEDLNSANGTYVNRARIFPGQPRPLAVNDVIQIGNVQLKVLA